MSISRKAFLGLGVATVASCALGGVAWASAPEDGLLRPPVVDDDLAFASRCLRCYRCVEACHTRAIVPAPLEKGIVSWSTPTLDFHRGPCDFCDECVRVCPTGALRSCDPEAPDQGRIGVAVVQPDRCIAYEYGCDICEVACPYQAITLRDGGIPYVDGAKCNGCGECEYQCPALVYRSFSGGTRRGIVVETEAVAFRSKEEEGERYGEGD